MVGHGNVSAPGHCFEEVITTQSLVRALVNLLLNQRKPVDQRYR